MDKKKLKRFTRVLAITARLLEAIVVILKLYELLAQ
jgi:preprotein translocase subunit SecY